MKKLSWEELGILWGCLLELHQLCGGVECSFDKRNRHVQARYCEADFVVKATIKNGSEKVNSDDGIWEVFPWNIKSQIKINKEFIDLPDPTLQDVWLSHPNNGTLVKGTKYIISGKMRFLNGKIRLTVSACEEWVQLWSELGIRHRASLRKGKFERGCNCWKSLPNEKPKGCEYSRKESLSSLYSSKSPKGIAECHKGHAYCTEHGKGCRWNPNRELELCLRNLQDIPIIS